MRGENPLRRQRWNRPLVVLLALALPVALSLQVWVAQRLRLPAPAHLELVCAGYELNVQVPHNVPGKNALKRLLRILHGTRRAWYERLAGYGLLSEHLRDLDREGSAVWKADGDRPSPKAVQLSKVESPTVIVVLALHGAVDDKGPYFIVQDSKPMVAREGRLRLDDILGTLASLPADRNKVLILDATGLDEQLELGMIHNSFTEELVALESQIQKIPGLVVFCASGQHQRSWVDRSSNETVFLHMLIRRLVVPRHLGRLSFDGLAQAVTRDVEDWVWTHRSALQRPILLPRGEEGLRRASRIDLPILAADSPDLGPPLDAAGLSNELSESWRGYHHVEGAEDPPYMPYVSSPGFWRLYQANVSRFDELVHAGDLDSARELKLRFQMLVTAMRGGQVRKLASSLGSLSMPMLSGEEDPSLAADPRISERFDKLWHLPPAEQPTEWSRWKAEVATPRAASELAPSGADLGGANSVATPDEGRSHPQWLTARVGGLILDRAIADPAKYLAEAARLARVLDDPLEVRPQELHFLVMLDRDLPPSTTRDHGRLVSRALRLRRLAERAILGLDEEGKRRSDTVAIPEVAALVRPVVLLGDEHRQLGQDLMFATDPTSLEDAERAFQEAEGWYRRAIMIGVRMRAALLLRDRVFADLPSYSQWLLGLRFPRNHPQSLEGLRGHLVELWRESHRLNELLSNVDIPAPGRGDREAVLAQLTRQAEALHRLSNRVIQALSVVKADLSKLVEERVKAQGEGLVEFCAQHLALTVLEPQDRKALEAAYWEARDLDRAAGPGASPRRSGISQREQESNTMILMRNRGLIALEMLGEHELTRGCQGAEETTGDETAAADRYHQLREFLETLSERSLDPQGVVEREQDIRQFGREIATHLDCLVERFNVQRRALAAVPSTPASSPGSATIRLAEDELIRRIGLVSIFSLDEQLLAADPVPARRLSDFLDTQSRRVSDDRWYGEESAGLTGRGMPPYFERVARVFLGDARDLAGTKAAGQESQQPTGNIRFLGPDRSIITSESRIELTYRLEADGDPVLRRGIAVAWISRDRPPPGTGSSQGSEKRHVMPLSPSQARTLNEAIQSPATGAIPPPGAIQTAANVRARALFRGRILDHLTEVTLQPMPEFRVVNLPAMSSGILVVSDVEARRSNPDGAIVIVLDASGSMAGDGSRPGRSKFAEAVESLKLVLSRLPAGTRVSVWAFGQATGSALTVEPERAIRCVLPPSDWNSGLLDGLIGDLASLRPWNKSAIVRALLDASQDLEGVDGYRAMVVLTDGEDNRWAGDGQANPQGQDVEQAIRARFDRSGIAIHFIAYRVDDSRTAEQVQAQFKVVTQLKVPGSFQSAADAASLSVRLQRSMPMGLRYRILRADNRPVPGMPPTGIPVARSGTLDRPVPLEPGSYRLWVQGEDQPSREFLVDPGCWLLLKLSGSGSSDLDLGRALYATEFFPLRPSRREPDSGWTLAALQNSTEGRGAMRMLLTLEKGFDRREEVLQSLRPRDLWIDLGPGVAREGRATTMVSAPGYPAAAWRARVDNWPMVSDAKQPETPTVEAWWDPDRPAVPDASLEAGREFARLEDLNGREFEIDGGRVTIESVTIEDATVMTDSERSQPQRCLVVRASHDRGHPVRIRLDAPGLLGSEERFYREAGKSAFLFWPAVVDQGRILPRRIELISLGRFKREAQRRGFHLRLDGLGSPTPGDPSPPTVSPRRPGTSVADEVPVTEPIPPQDGGR